MIIFIYIYIYIYTFNRYQHVARPYNSYPGAIKYMYSMHNSSGQLSRECVASFGPTGEAWKCLMAPHAQGFVKTPFFAIQSRFDEFQLGKNARVPCLNNQAYAYVTNPPTNVP